jgi:RNA polymerase sigma factor (sigma-70 family)
MTDFVPLPLAEQHRLVLANRGLVYTIARRFVTQLGFDDMIAWGNMGLVEAARRFDPDLGFVFGTYAAWWIRAFIWKAEARDRGLNVHSSTQRVFFGIKKAITKCEREGIDPTNEQIATMLNVTVQAVSWIRPIVIFKPVQIDHAGPQGDETWGNDRVTFPQLMEHATPESQTTDAFDADVTKKRLELAMRRLTPKERDVIKRRYLGKNETLQAIGDEMGLSRERVRQVEVKAVGRLRAMMKKAG